ncbi:MAG TPA: 2-oxoacid:acceptor oxidoreductase family protein [Candidatus Portnoybacteria bacterium]|nr:2-oxoacid:acceptor oxidoreductase family protein [Candidatus Portnoybacteria bacterium]
MMKKTKIIIVGMGGQGVQTIAKILALTAAQKGLEVSYIPQFGVEQRGTPSVAFITLDSKKVNYPLFDIADWAVVLHPRAIAEAVKYVDKKTKTIFDSSLMGVEKINKKPVDIFGLPAVKLATENFSSRLANLIVLGQVSRILELPFELAWKNTAETLEKKLKNETARKASRDALLLGYENLLEKKSFSKPDYRPKAGTIIFDGDGKQGFLISEHCKSCGICVAKCPIGAIKMGHNTGVFASPLPEIDIAKCSVCGTCSLFCPDGAIKTERKK